MGNDMNQQGQGGQQNQGQGGQSGQKSGQSGQQGGQSGQGKSGQQSGPQAAPPAWPLGGQDQWPQQQWWQQWPLESLAILAHLTGTPSRCSGRATSARTTS